MLIATYIFLLFTIVSGTLLFIMLRSQLAHIKEASQNSSFILRSVRYDMYKIVQGVAIRFWDSNSHRIEKVFVSFAKLGGKFEAIVLRFVNFVWGKNKIEKNGGSKYWNEIIEHKNGLSKDKE